MHDIGSNEDHERYILSAVDITHAISVRSFFPNSKLLRKQTKDKRRPKLPNVQRRESYDPGVKLVPSLRDPHQVPYTDFGS